MIIRSDESKEKWQSLVEAQLSSGLTQIQWCEEQGVNINNFRYWKSRLKAKVEQPREITNFVAIKPAMSLKACKMRIRIGKATIEIDDEVDPLVLSSVIKVLSDYV